MQPDRREEHLWDFASSTRTVVDYHHSDSEFQRLPHDLHCSSQHDYWRPKYDERGVVNRRESSWTPSPPSLPPKHSDIPEGPKEIKVFDYAHVCDNPALEKRILDYNHGPETHGETVSASFVEHYDQYRLEVAASLPPISHFLKKPGIQNKTDIVLDEEKRKLLPAWILEGLERMEQKQMEKKQRIQRSDSYRGRHSGIKRKRIGRGVSNREWHKTTPKRATIDYQSRRIQNMPSNSVQRDSGVSQIQSIQEHELSKKTVNDIIDHTRILHSSDHPGDRTNNSQHESLNVDTRNQNLARDKMQESFKASLEMSRTQEQDVQRRDKTGNRIDNFHSDTAHATKRYDTPQQSARGASHRRFNVRVRNRGGRGHFHQNSASPMLPPEQIPDNFSGIRKIPMMQIQDRGPMLTGDFDIRTAQVKNQPYVHEGDGSKQRIGGSSLQMFYNTARNRAPRAETYQNIGSRIRSPDRIYESSQRINENLNSMTRPNMFSNPVVGTNFKMLGEKSQRQFHEIGQNRGSQGSFCPDIHFISRGRGTVPSIGSCYQRGRGRGIDPSFF